MLKFSGRPHTLCRMADVTRVRRGTAVGAGNNPTLSANERTQTVFSNTTHRQIIQFSKQLLPNQTSYPQTDAKVTLHRHKATVSKFIIMFYWTLSARCRLATAAAADRASLLKCISVPIADSNFHSAIQEDLQKIIIHDGDSLLCAMCKLKFM